MSEHPDPSNVTIADVVRRYRDEDTRLRQVEYHTAQHYLTLCRSLEKTCGNVTLSELNEAKVNDIYSSWIEGQRIGMASGQIGQLRRICTFAAEIMGEPEGDRVVGLLTRMAPTFKRPATRAEHLNEQQVIAIRRAAHKKNRPSIALAQALQFQCPLKQRDVIGEWVPIGDAGVAAPGITYERDGLRWVRGLRWSNIEGHTLHLPRPIKENGRTIYMFDLKRAPMVMEELAKRHDSLPADRSTALIVTDKEQQPWVPGEFRRWWRRIAKEAGIPAHVRNMDTRLGRRIAEANK